MTPLDRDRFREQFESRQLIRESEWTRVYKFGKDHLHYESKFLDGNLAVSADEFKKKWSTYNTQEKSEFVQAYSVKPTIFQDDIEILRYLMGEWSEDVCGWIIPRLTQIPERDLVLEFLLAKIAKVTDYFPSYVLALTALGDRRAVSAMKDKFNQFRVRVKGITNAQTPESFFDCVCYLHCCKALIKLSGSADAERALAEMQNFSDERVRAIARHMNDEL